MNLVLIGFSQDVNFENLRETHNFLKLRRPDGTELRLPVPEETVQALIQEAAKGPAHEGALVVEETPEPQDPEGPLVDGPPETEETVADETTDATEFGDEPPADEGVRGQIELTDEDLREAGIDPAEYRRPRRSSSAAKAVPPPRRPTPVPRAGNQRPLVVDDGVPSL